MPRLIPKRESSAKREVLVRKLPIDALKLNPRNPNRHERGQIKKIARSIEKFGFLVPVLIDSGANVIAGHGRILAAITLGMTELPVIKISHLNQEQITAFMLADNQLCRIGQWDQRLLAETFKQLTELNLDFELEITGFSITEIDLLIESLEGAEANDSLDTEGIPQPDALPVTNPGDMWILGPHRVLCADALKPESYDTLMGNELASAVFSDPPFNVRISGHVSGRGKRHHREFPMASGELDESQFIDFLRTALGNLAGRCVDGAVMFLCMDWRHIFEILTAARSVRCKLLNLCIWAKPRAGLGSFYRSQHELVLVFRSGSAPHRNNIELGRHGRNRSNLWQYSSGTNFGRGTEDEKLAAAHPTPKPISMVADAIKDCTRRGDIVLDAFLGAGASLLAAQRTGRRCFGLELDPLFIDTTIRRWQALTGKPAVCAASGETFDQRQVELEKTSDAEG